MVENPQFNITKDMLCLADTCLGAIELTAKRMAINITDSKRGRKKSIELSAEEQLLLVPEYVEIRQTLLLAKSSLGLITEEECGVSSKQLRDSRDAVKKKLGLKNG